MTSGLSSNLYQNKVEEKPLQVNNSKPNFSSQVSLKKLDQPKK